MENSDDNLHARVSVLEASQKHHAKEIEAVEGRTEKKIEDVDTRLAALRKTLFTFATVVLMNVVTQVLSHIGMK